MENKINFNGEFFYFITGKSMIILKNADGDEIIKSRDISRVAKKIIEDPDIFTAYEQDMINVNDHSVKYDLDEHIQSIKVRETLHSSEDF